MAIFQRLSLTTASRQNCRNKIFGGNFFDDISQNVMANNFWSSFSRNEEKKMKNESKFNLAVAAKLKISACRQTELFTDKNS